MVKNQLLETYLYILQEDNIEEIAITLPAVMTAVSILSLANTIYQSYITKTGRRCRGMTGAMKSLCAAQVHLEGYEQKLRSLQQSLTKCNTDNCRQKIRDKINDTQQKMEKYKSMINLYKEKVKLEKEKERAEIAKA